MLGMPWRMPPLASLPFFNPKTPREKVLLLMEEILHQLKGSLSYFLQGFRHPRWCRISSINSITKPPVSVFLDQTTYIQLYTLYTLHIWHIYIYYMYLHYIRYSPNALQPRNIETLIYPYMSWWLYLVILGIKLASLWTNQHWSPLEKKHPRDPQVREELRERRTGLPCDQRQLAEAREIDGIEVEMGGCFRPPYGNNLNMATFCWKGKMSFAKWNFHFWVQHVCVYLSVSDLSQLGMLLNSQPENENSMALRDVLVGRGLCIWRFQPWENNEDLRIWPETQWSQWLGYKNKTPSLRKIIGDFHQGMVNMAGIHAISANSSPLQMDGWKTPFFLGRPIFRGKLLVLGRVAHGSCADISHYKFPVITSV